HTCDVIRAISVLLEAIGQTDGQGDHHANRSAKKLIERYTVSGNNQLKRDQFIDGCKNDSSPCGLLARDD
ncbi:unnamed protein product, partial [Adineta ricciae]